MEERLKEFYERHVIPYIDESRDARRYAVEYAQIAIRSSYILNGGALIAIPAYATMFKKSMNPDDIVWAAIAFVAGLLMIILSTIACHANFYCASDLFRATAIKQHDELIKRLDNDSHKSMDLTNLAEVVDLDASIRRSSKQIRRTFQIAWTTGLLSYLAFLFGSFLLGRSALSL